MFQENVSVLSYVLNGIMQSLFMRAVCSTSFRCVCAVFGSVCACTVHTGFIKLSNAISHGGNVIFLHKMVIQFSEIAKLSIIKQVVAKTYTTLAMPLPLCTYYTCIMTFNLMSSHENGYPLPVRMRSMSGD